ncbi:MAG: hypothetical protein LBT31_03855 [Synergistaceae bacterium]|nr:hypothetical protein [Synergistaceae bacterium]
MMRLKSLYAGVYVPSTPVYDPAHEYPAQVAVVMNEYWAAYYPVPAPVAVVRPAVVPHTYIIYR